MQHYFIKRENLDLSINEVTIIEDAFHITNVMRMKPGEEITVVVDEKAYLIELTVVNQNKCNGRIIKNLNYLSELRTKVTIAHAVVRREKQEDTIEKLTELGASGYVPVIMEHCNVKIDLDKQDKKRMRLEKIIKEASEQSHRLSLMKLYAVHSFKELLKLSSQFDLCLVCDTTTDPYQISSIFKNEKNSNILILIGPEGGISTKELELLEQFNFQKISLGNRILRTEVAPLYIMSVIAASEEIL